MTTTITPTKRDELRLLINSHQPIITVETAEEERLESLLADVALEMNIPFFRWSVTSGLARFHGEPIYNTDNPEAALSNIALIAGDGIFLLKDFPRYCENDKICRRLRDLGSLFRVARRSIVLCAPTIELPPELDCDAVPFHFSLPSADELLAGVKQILAESKLLSELDAAGIRQLARNLEGMPQQEAL